MTQQIPIASVQVGDQELAAAMEVLRSGNLVQGEKAAQLEEGFVRATGAGHATAVSSGTAALHIAYLAVLEEGDEVLVPSFTHISTASMVSFAGGKPVFCDIDPETFTIDVEDARSKVTPRTRAIAPVHLYGNAADVEAIRALAEEYELKIIWDAAQAHGTTFDGTDVGSFPDLVCYSFYPTKNMFTGEGGMITCSDPDLAERCRLLRAHGQTEKYLHPVLGLNYRMTDVEAAIGVEQLEKLPGFLEARRRNAELLDDGLRHVPGIRIPAVPDAVEHSYHQYTVLVDPDEIGMSRDDLKEALKVKGVGTGVHYPRSIHEQPAFVERLGKVTLPVCEEYSQRVLSLPVHPGVEERDIKVITEAIQSAIQSR